MDADLESNRIRTFRKRQNTFKTLTSARLKQMTADVFLDSEYGQRHFVYPLTPEFCLITAVSNTAGANNRAPSLSPSSPRTHINSDTAANRGLLNGSPAQQEGEHLKRRPFQKKSSGARELDHKRDIHRLLVSAGRESDGCNETSLLPGQESRRYGYPASSGGAGPRPSRCCSSPAEAYLGGEKRDTKLTGGRGKGVSERLSE